MYIVIPEPEPMVNLETGEPALKADGSPAVVTMQKMLAEVIYTNPYLGDDGEDIAERIWRIRHLFFGQKPGAVVEVEASDVKAVCAIIAKPDGDGKRTTGKCNACGGRPAVRWVPELASFCVPHFRAWRNASHTDPRKENPAP